MQHMAKAIQNLKDGGPADPPLLDTDQIQLYSYYRPGLVAGAYEVSVVQDIEATVPSDRVKQQKLRVVNIRNNQENILAAEPQKFEVVVPRFTLDPNLINSYYPPDGHQDEGRILPHIVLNDPHFPWEIDAGSTAHMSGPIDGDRNIVPWIALVVFDPDELHLPKMDNITDLGVHGVESVNGQNAKGTFSMTAKDYFEFVPKLSRVDVESGYGENHDLLNEVKSSTDEVQVIFPTKLLFRDMFGDCESMKYLAHVRNINTKGFPDAGVEQLGLYSVVISSRTGRFDITQPTTQVCHLVSIENFDKTLNGVNTWLNEPHATGPDRIGIFSLYSWVYTALPPDPVNFVDTVENLVRHQQMFRADQPTLDALQASLQGKTPDLTKPKASQVLVDRLASGYTFTRWRAETGEETAALNRGPLVPQRQPSTPAADLPDCSNTSKDFQILDKDTGLMDLSYSTAWQLGKTLAIADSSFSAAMLRFRSILHNTTSGETRATLNKMTPKPELLTSLSASMQHVNNLAGGTSPGQPRRVEPRVVPAPLSDITDADAKPLFRRTMQANMVSRTNAGNTQFNGFNEEPANDTDWVIIHNWMADKLFLGGIPPHYLIPEPSFIPTEGLRFFYIDDFWIDCLLDGALSVANHVDHDNDIWRTEVKRRFNMYLREQVPRTGIKPQIPSYGFILRSKMVKTMPDLRITVNWTVADPQGHERHPVCRYTRFDDTTLICLLDRQPEELDSIILAQPPHQQCFSLGYSLTGPHRSPDPAKPDLPGRLEFKLRKLYTKDAPSGEWEMSDAQPSMAPDPANAKDDQTKNWYNWDSRCIQLRTMMTEMTVLLQRSASANPPDGEYIDTVPNSCALGIELNSPSYYFVIRPPKNSPKMVPAPEDGSSVNPPDKVIEPRDRQLYINLAADEFQPTPAKKPAPASPPAPGTAIPGTKTSPSVGPPPTGPPPLSSVQPITNRFPPSLLALRAKPVLSSGGGAAPIQLQSQFALNIYADYKPFPKPRDKDGFDPAAYLPTQNLFLYDLIFSLRKIVSKSAFPLLEIQIDLPNEGLDPGSKDPNQEPLLTKSYAGAGARMLSNQRFVPLVYIDTDHLRVRLIPRTAGDSYQFELSDDKSRELSFRLAEPDVAHVRAGQFVPVKGSPGRPQFRGVAKVTMVEIYAAGPSGTWPVTSTVEVVKWGTRDDEDKALEVAENKEVGRGS
jgi:hypothetical protein